MGTSVLQSLADEQRVEEIVGIARRVPERRFPRTRFVAADITAADLSEHFKRADAVIHHAWLIQPGRNQSAKRPGADPRAADRGRRARTVTRG